MPESAEEIFYFDGSDALEAVFAGNIVANLSLIDRKLDVTSSSRDMCVKIISDNHEGFKKAVGLINELIVIYRAGGKMIPQQDFDHLLRAFCSHREKEVNGLFSERIKVGKRKPDIIPRTLHQLEYIRDIRSKDIVFGIGPAGTGKTYLAMAMAVSEFLSGKYSRIVLSRPAREAGENLGFLPGTLEDKILPYLRPLYDALYDMLDFDEVRSLMEKNIIEVAPLAFMRGRTLNHAFIILDEAQNASTDQMLMFLTRLGFDSCCVITGDPSQTDLMEKQQPGLLHARDVLKDIPEIAFCHFNSKDVVRHSLVEKIIEAYSLHKSTSPKKTRRGAGE